MIRMSDPDEVLSRVREAEREFKRDKRADMLDLMEALRQSVEEAKRLREQVRRQREHGFKVGEAAEMIGVHRNTMRGWIERGLLKASRDEMSGRGDYLIPFSEVERARRARFVSAAADPLSDAQAESYERLLDRTRKPKPKFTRPSRVGARRRAAS